METPKMPRICRYCYYFDYQGIMKYHGSPLDVRSATLYPGCKKFDRLLKDNTEACPDFRPFYDIPKAEPRKPSRVMKFFRSLKVKSP